jgi:acetyltransferase-like isoleucine patch superfamily enzyme
MIQKMKETTIWGAHSYGTISTNGAEIRVGRYCSIAGGVRALTYPDHQTQWITTYPFGKLWGVRKAESDVVRQNKVMIVENDVWIGAYATLLEDTVIRNGAIIGSHAIVHGEIPPYSIAVGNPARVVKQRFTDEQIQALLRIRWWDWEPEKVREFTPLLCSPNIEEFIRKVEAEHPQGGKHVLAQME